MQSSGADQLSELLALAVVKAEAFVTMTAFAFWLHSPQPVSSPS
jgi:hypothetical protein